MAQNHRTDLFAVPKRQMLMAVAVEWSQPLFQPIVIWSQVEHVRRIDPAGNDLPQGRRCVQGRDALLRLGDLFRAGEVGLGEQDPIGHRHLSSRLRLARELHRAMQRIHPASDDTCLVFDMSAVRYMDHRALLTLDAFAQKCPVPVVVRSMPRIVRRVARVLGLEQLGGVHLGDSA